MRDRKGRVPPARPEGKLFIYFAASILDFVTGVVMLGLIIYFHVTGSAGWLHSAPFVAIGLILSGIFFFRGLHGVIKGLSDLPLAMPESSSGKSGQEDISVATIDDVACRRCGDIRSRELPSRTDPNGSKGREKCHTAPHFSSREGNHHGESQGSSVDRPRQPWHGGQ